MAKSCVEGKERLYDYARERGIPHRRCGKLIVATSTEERAALATLKKRGALNGVHDLALLEPKEALRLEPELACEAALLSPSSGIIDSHSYMLSLQGDAEDAGASFAFRSPVLRGRIGPRGIELHIGGEDPIDLIASTFVNSAGLHAPALAATIEGLPPKSIPIAYFAKGHYMSLSARSPFSRLIYPIPVPGGLGVHLTHDIAGQARFGPDVEWVDGIDYRTDQSRSPSFERAIRRYWPRLPDGALEPGYSGIRPKIAPPGSPPQDFMIQGPRDHGAPGIINLYGIESPGLTSSMALADLVVRISENPQERL
jgi:L-2-hydroxyglutarate oxidase LhgO